MNREEIKSALVELAEKMDETDEEQLALKGVLFGVVAAFALRGGAMRALLTEGFRKQNEMFEALLQAPKYPGDVEAEN